jgi:hypothetical protein
MDKKFFIIFISYFISHDVIIKIEKILKIIENIDYKKNQKPPFNLSYILKKYWIKKPNTITGYAVDDDKNLKVFNGVWNWNNKTFSMKLSIDDNNFSYEGNYLIINNNIQYDLMDINYHMNSSKQLIIYNLLKLRYLKFINKNQFSLKENNLHFINYILQNQWQYFYNLSFNYLGYMDNYNIFLYPNDKFYILLLTQSSQLKYFIIYRKKFSFHKIIFFL